jgi:hypothetical protein
LKKNIETYSLGAIYSPKVSSLCVAFKPTDSGLQNSPYCSYQESDWWNNSQSDKDNTGFRCGERREWREHRIDRVLGFFLQSSELGSPPTPSPSGKCVPPLIPEGKGDTLACGRGGGGSQLGRGDRHCGTLGTYVLCGREVRRGRRLHMYKRRMTNDEVLGHMRMRNLDDGHFENERTGCVTSFYNSALSKMSSFSDFGRKLAEKGSDLIHSPY